MGINDSVPAFTLPGSLSPPSIYPFSLITFFFIDFVKKQRLSAHAACFVLCILTPKF
jgi:hypothetical protein